VSRKVVIGISDCEKFQNYERWILAEPDVEVIRLGAQFSNLDEIRKCDGIVLTGGEDVHPRFYGKTIQYPNAPTEFEEVRDEFEVRMFKIAQESNLPLLGICRGLQLINCIQGGTLKQDLGERNDVHKRISRDDKMHDVKIELATLLFGITKVNHGLVNSSHHQAIDKLGHGLKINCHAADGTVEGVEGTGSSHPFLLAVQWHPERMTDKENPLSGNVKRSFLDQCRKLF
jgi:putative glutamine amidotransferase